MRPIMIQRGLRAPARETEFPPKRPRSITWHWPLRLALLSSQILNLKLRKRYYAEALDFIRHVEGAMEVIGQLLGSTNKAEVLESIEFFRVAYEYQIMGSEV